MTNPPILTDLMADPGELDVSYLDCHHNTTVPVATLLRCYAVETPFPEACGGFRCSACGSQGGWTFGPTGPPAKRQGRSPHRKARLGTARRRDRRPVRWLMFIAPLQIAVLNNPAKEIPIPVPDGRFGQRRRKPEQKGRTVPRCGFDRFPVDH
jgi:hypothetical protein